MTDLRDFLRLKRDRFSRRISRIVPEIESYKNGIFIGIWGEKTGGSYFSEAPSGEASGAEVTATCPI
jgi:hypothetical protein